MSTDGRVSYYIDKYGIFYKILQKRNSPITQELPQETKPAVSATWLRLIVLFWNFRVMKAALRFGVAAVIMNQYERLGFAVLLLCFAL